MEFKVIGIELEATPTHIRWTLSRRHAKNAGVERSHAYGPLDDGSATVEVAFPTKWDEPGWIRIRPPAPDDPSPPTEHGAGTVYLRPGSFTKGLTTDLRSWIEDARGAGVQVIETDPTRASPDPAERNAGKAAHAEGASAPRRAGTGSAVSDAPESPEWMDTARLWGRRLRKLTSWRVLGTAILVGILGGLALSYIWEPLGTWAFWPLFVTALLLAMFNDDAVLYCPHCGKRVKVGHDTCHHCGRDVK